VLDQEFCEVGRGDGANEARVGTRAASLEAKIKTGLAMFLVFVICVLTSRFFSCKVKHIFEPKSRDRHMFNRR
jgi:hypothetical protein